MDIRFAPVARRFNVQLVSAGAANVGNLTANTTNTYFLALPPGKYFVTKLGIVTNQVPVDADGTLLATFYKWDGVANTSVALNTANSLESLTGAETRSVTVLATLTDAQRIINTADNGDALYVAVVSNSAAIDTQPTNLTFSAELAVLK